MTMEFRERTEDLNTERTLPVPLELQTLLCMNFMSYHVSKIVRYYVI